jgi:hypothetical protein
VHRSNVGDASSETRIPVPAPSRTVVSRNVGTVPAPAMVIPTRPISATSQRDSVPVALSESTIPTIGPP